MEDLCRRFEGLKTSGNHHANCQDTPSTIIENQVASYIQESQNTAQCGRSSSPIVTPSAAFFSTGHDNGRYLDEQNHGLDSQLQTREEHHAHEAAFRCIELKSMKMCDNFPGNEEEICHHFRVNYKLKPKHVVERKNHMKDQRLGLKKKNTETISSRMDIKSLQESGLLRLVSSLDMQVAVPHPSDPKAVLKFDDVMDALILPKKKRKHGKHKSKKKSSKKKRSKSKKLFMQQFLNDFSLKSLNF